MTGGDNATVFTKASVNRTKAALKAAERKLIAAAPSAEAAGAAIVAREMRARAPVRSGELRASIGTSGSQAQATAGHAIPVDRGVPGRNMAAQPYAEDGAKAAAPEVIATMAARFRAALGGR